MDEVPIHCLECGHEFVAKMEIKDNKMPPVKCPKCGELLERDYDADEI